MIFNREPTPVFGFLTGGLNMQKRVCFRRKILQLLRSSAVFVLIFAVAFAAPGCSLAGLTAGGAVSPASAVSRLPSSSGPAAVSSAQLTEPAASSAAPGRAAGTDVRTVHRLSSSLSAGTLAQVQARPVAVPNAAGAAVQQRSGYRSLASQEERSLYSMIGDSVLRIATRKSAAGAYPTARIVFPKMLSEARLRVILSAYLNDNPQIFWLENAYSYGYESGYTVLQLYSVLAPDACAAAARRLQDTVAAVVRAMPAGLGEFGREEYLFQYLVSHCTYDNAAVTDSSRWKAFTSYGALVEGLAVCEGYSRAMQMLAGYAGLNCSLVLGNSGGVGHMWNVIEIDGKWYHLDATWCDEAVLIYNYFNVTDSVISLTHSVGQPVSSLTDAQICSGNIPYNLFLPKCDSVEANYFRVRGISATSGDRAVEAALAREMKQKASSVAFYLPGSSNFDSQVQALVSAPSYKLYRWVEAAAKQSGGNPDPNSLVYVPDKADRGITVHIGYR
jgi:hypothetical protein